MDNIDAYSELLRIIKIQSETIKSAADASQSFYLTSIIMILTAVISAFAIVAAPVIRDFIDYIRTRKERLLDQKKQLYFDGWKAAVWFSKTFRELQLELLWSAANKYSDTALVDFLVATSYARAENPMENFFDKTAFSYPDLKDDSFRLKDDLNKVANQIEETFTELYNQQPSSDELSNNAGFQVVVNRSVEFLNDLRNFTEILRERAE